MKEGIILKKISVILPIYNTKEELKKCLSSICNQTYNNLEIICIDDGSTDGSENVLDEFAGKDSRIIAIHQVNGGESNARNVGLRKATGEYIAFCDCDDWIDSNMYQVLIEAMEKDNLDMVASGWYKEVNEKGTWKTEEIKNKLSVSSDIFSRDELLKYIYMRDSYRGFAYMWNKLYKRELLYNVNGALILFDENLKLGGDVVYLAEAALNVKKAKYINRAFYHYNQRENSGCHTEDLERFRDWLKAYEYILNRFQEEKISKEILDYVKRFMVYHSSNAVEIAYAQNNRNALEIFQSFMRQYETEYICLNQQYPERIDRYYEIMNYTIEI